MVLQLVVLVARLWALIKDPQQVADKWNRRIQAASPDIEAGIRNVSQAPGAAAVAKRNKYVQGIQSSVDKWARNTGRVGLEEWRQKALDVGVPRVAQGAAANVDKVEAFHREFLPYLEQGVQKVRAMPDDNQAARIQRAVAMMQHTAGFRRGR